MSRINTNVDSLIAQNALAQNNANLSTSLQRLSTGLRINSGADDPAGLIASENLKAQMAGINQGISNAQRATNVVATAEGGLTEVSSLLTQLDSLVGQSANSGGLSSDEVQANQLQVDSILSTINRIAGSTSFEGKNLLDGTMAYSTSSVATSAFSTMQINAATLPDAQKMTVVVQVTNSATKGTVTYTDPSDNKLNSAVTLTIAGNLGTQQLSFASGTALSAVAAGINGLSNVTGVTASANNGTHALAFSAQDYGSSQFVSIAANSAFFTSQTTGGVAGRAAGTDAEVTVNGGKAQADGTNISYSNASLDVNFDLTAGLNAGQSKTFAITGGGATFAIGSEASESGKASIGIQSVSTGSLGDANTGFLSELASGQSLSLSSGNLSQAQSVVNEAINQVAELNGRLGAFQTYTLGSTVNSLGVAYENASAAESNIADTDFAQETANMTQDQILVQAATTVLATANSNPQNVLTLLKGG